jgi:type VI secretion system secreted protein VgrG
MATRRLLREPASVSADRRTTVRGKLTHHVKGDASYTVGHNRAAEIGRNDQLSVAGDRKVEIGGGDAVRVGRDRTTSIGKDDHVSVAGRLLIDAGDEVTLTAGVASITLRKDGTVVIKGKDIVIDAAGAASIRAAGDLVIKGKKIVET